MFSDVTSIPNAGVLNTEMFAAQNTNYSIAPNAAGDPMVVVYNYDNSTTDSLQVGKSDRNFVFQAGQIFADQELFTNKQFSA